MQLQDGLSHHRIEHIALGEQSRCQDVEQPFTFIAYLEPSGCEEIGELLQILACRRFAKIVDETIGEEAAAPVKRGDALVPRLEGCAYHLGAGVAHQCHLRAQFDHLVELRGGIFAKRRMPSGNHRLKDLVNGRAMHARQDFYSVQNHTVRLPRQTQWLTFSNHSRRSPTGRHLSVDLGLPRYVLN